MAVSALSNVHVVKWGTTRCEARGCKTCPTICAELLRSGFNQVSHHWKSPPRASLSHVQDNRCCLKCGKQYVGETSQALHLRMNGHLSDIRRKTGGSPLLFPRPQVRPPVRVVDQTPLGDSRDTVLRKNREARWIRCPKTAQPEGMNIRPAVTLSCHFF